MPMHNLIKYSNAYLKISGSSWQYYRDKPTSNDNGIIIDFPNDNNNSISFKFKQQITGNTGKNGTKDVKIMIQLKYPSSFWRTLDMPLNNCEISLMITLSKIWFLVAGIAANQEPTFTITDTKLYVPVLTLSTQDNIKLLKRLKSGFKRTINWNNINLN